MCKIDLILIKSLSLSFLNIKEVNLFFHKHVYFILSVQLSQLYQLKSKHLRVEYIENKVEYNK